MRFSSRHYQYESTLSANICGNAIIEFSIILPFLLVIVLGCIEFGMYFVKSEITNNAISTVANTLERNPNYYNTLSQNQWDAVVKSYGSGLIDFSQSGNYICADSYTTTNQATSAPACTSTHFNASNPTGNPASPYYIVVRASLSQANITSLGNFIPAVKNIKVSQSSGSIQLNGSGTPPVCTQVGYALQFDGTNFVCSPIAPNCSQPWQKLEYTNNNFTCVNVPFIVAAGVAWPTTSASSGVIWDTDFQFQTHSPYTNLTICQQNVQFTVPSGLPPGGQLLATGNLIYPGATNNGAWHGWAVSFVHYNAPLSGGTGSMDVCMSSGGEWTSAVGPNTKPGVFTEHVSWSVFWMPN